MRITPVTRGASALLAAVVAVVSPMPMVVSAWFHLVEDVNQEGASSAPKLVARLDGYV